MAASTDNRADEIAHAYYEHDKNVELGREPGTIKAVDKESVHRICSGQVVLTLATAVKELVENSVDAGATCIEIKLKEYGAESIEVSDNGSGVEEKNFEGLTLKHHTSKLYDFNDLVNVTTFGFRGEALSSLCALSNMTIVTRHDTADVGTKLVMDGNGKIVFRSPVPRQRGTSVTVQNLFYSLPVRHREFQRNLKREFSKMVQVLNAYCLINTGVRISCHNQIGKGNRTTVICTNGSPSVKASIADIFGSKQLQSLMLFEQHNPTEDICTEFGIKPDQCQTCNLRVEGFISKCEHGQGRSSADRQFVFINRRPCDAQKILRLINEIYHSYNRHQYPFVVLLISMSSGSVDVNVTPDKRQIFVEGENILLATLKASLVQMFEPTTAVIPVRVIPCLSASDISVSSPEEESNSPVFSSSQIPQTASFRLTTPANSSMSASLAKLKRSFSSSFDKSNAGTPESAQHNKQMRLDLCASRSHSLPAGNITERSDDKRSIMRFFLPSPKLQAFVHREAMVSNVNVDVGVTGCDSKMAASGLLEAGAVNNSAISTMGQDNVTDRQPMAHEHHHSSSCVQTAEDLNEEAVEETASDEPDGVCSFIQTASETTVLQLCDVEGLTDVDREDIPDGNSGAVDSFCHDPLLLPVGAKGSLTAERNNTVDRPSNSVVRIFCKGKTSSVCNRDEHHRECADEILQLQQDSRKSTGPTYDSEIEQDREMQTEDLLFSFQKLKECLQAMKREKAIQKKNFSRLFRAKICPNENQTAEEELKRQISKSMFSEMEVLGQFNLGFIIARNGQDLFIVDQHATDEKYNFEMLQQNTILQSQLLLQPQTLELTAANEIILLDNLHIFQKNGFDFLVDETAPPTQRVKLKSTPVSKNWHFGRADIEELIFMLTDSPGVTCRPSRVHMMFASRACRKSVMIGTALNKAEMKKLLCHMGEIDQPWNCPHGRPTMRHLLNLDMLP